MDAPTSRCNSNFDSKIAINVDTTNAISSYNGNKNHKYVCPQCNQSVIFKSGDIIKNYFSHLPNQQINCDYYDNYKYNRYNNLISNLSSTRRKPKYAKKSNNQTVNTTIEIDENVFCLLCDKPVHLYDDGSDKYYVHYTFENKTCDFTPASESIDHYCAKKKIKLLLEHGKIISIENLCQMRHLQSPTNLSLSTNDKCLLEYHFIFNQANRYADLAIIDSSNNIKHIIEIYSSHRTSENNRPEPWYELSSLDVLKHKTLYKNLRVTSNCLDCKAFEEKNYLLCIESIKRNNYDDSHKTIITKHHNLNQDILINNCLTSIDDLDNIYILDCLLYNSNVFPHLRSSSSFNIQDPEHLLLQACFKERLNIIKYILNNYQILYKNISSLFESNENNQQKYEKSISYLKEYFKYQSVNNSYNYQSAFISHDQALLDFLVNMCVHISFDSLVDLISSCQSIDFLNIFAQKYLPQINSFCGYNDFLYKDYFMTFIHNNKYRHLECLIDVSLSFIDYDKDYFVSNAINMASKLKRYDILKLLINTFKDNKYCGLAFYYLRNNTEMIALLESNKYSYNSSLNYSAAAGKLASLEYLVKSKSIKNNTCLNKAINSNIDGHKKALVIKFLLENGFTFDTNLLNKYPDTITVPRRLKKYSGKTVAEIIKDKGYVTWFLFKTDFFDDIDFLDENISFIIALLLRYKFQS